jgi:hypothetical protein
MHKLTRIALVGTSPAVAARVKAALEGRGSARDCDPIALVGPVGAPLTYTDDQAARNALRDFGYREMLQPGMVVPLVGVVGDAYARKYPSYTTKQLEAFIAAGRGSAEMIDEVAARKDGRSIPRITPQIAPLGRS